LGSKGGKKTEKNVLRKKTRVPGGGRGRSRKIKGEEQKHWVTKEHHFKPEKTKERKNSLKESPIIWFFVWKALANPM